MADNSISRYRLDHRMNHDSGPPCFVQLHHSTGGTCTKSPREKARDSKYEWGWERVVEVCLQTLQIKKSWFGTDHIRVENVLQSKFFVTRALCGAYAHSHYLATFETQANKNTAVQGDREHNCAQLHEGHELHFFWLASIFSLPINSPAWWKCPLNVSERWRKQCVHYESKCSTGFHESVTFLTGRHYLSIQ